MRKQQNRYILGLRLLSRSQIARGVKPAMESKRDKSEFHADNFVHAHENIVCKTCKFRFIEIANKMADRPDADCCEKIPYPKSKPDSIYFNGAPCKRYVKG